MYIRSHQYQIDYMTMSFLRPLSIGFLINKLRRELYCYCAYMYTSFLDENGVYFYKWYIFL